MYSVTHLCISLPQLHHLSLATDEWDTKAYELKAKYGHAGREGLSAESVNAVVSDKRNLPPGQRDLLQARGHSSFYNSSTNLVLLK